MGGIDDGALRSIQLSCRTVHLSQKQPLSNNCSHQTNEVKVIQPKLTAVTKCLLQDSCSIQFTRQRNLLLQVTKVLPLYMDLFMTGIRFIVCKVDLQHLLLYAAFFEMIYLYSVKSLKKKIEDILY